jgi:hypothetical protein
VSRAPRRGLGPSTGTPAMWKAGLHASMSPRVERRRGRRAGPRRNARAGSQPAEARASLPGGGRG